MPRSRVNKGPNEARLSVTGERPLRENEVNENREGELSARQRDEAQEHDPAAVAKGNGRI
jgi:hypothetical protein